jgi:Thioredoxin
MMIEPSAHLILPVGERDHAQGRADAPLTRVEYGDFECPYCGMAYPIVEAAQRRLGEGLRFVFRNFPISTASDGLLYLLWLQEKDRLRADRLDEIAIYLFLDCALGREQATRRCACASI